jgi:hypothetical protein
MIIVNVYVKPSKVIRENIPNVDSLKDKLVFNYFW